LGQGSLFHVRLPLANYETVPVAAADNSRFSPTSAT
jgi:hypothetical protein